LGKDLEQNSEEKLVKDWARSSVWNWEQYLG
jgi:hypothetical protein